jgi:hypothetical protein
VGDSRARPEGRRRDPDARRRTGRGRDRQLWLGAAALASPAVSAIGLARHAGAALASDAIKLSASQVLEMPLPVHGDAWRDGAAHLQAASAAAAMGEGTRWWSELDAFASAMTRAYDTSEDVREWWLARVPAFR